MIDRTSDTAQFLLAKYTPDLRRMEPRNIGIVVWTPNACAARFSEVESVVGIEDKENFGMWVRYWTRQCEQGVDFRGDFTPADSPDFLNALRLTQKGNYQLVDGGVLLNAISGSEVDSVVDQLFSELVANPMSSVKPKRKDDVTAPGLRAIRNDCRDVFEDLGIWKKPEFKRGPEIPIKVHGVYQQFRFDFKWSVARPYLVHAVNIADTDCVRSTSFMFDWGTRARSLDLASARFIAAIDSSNERLDATALSRNTDLLNGFGEVVDFAEKDHAGRSLQKLLDL